MNKLTSIFMGTPAYVMPSLYVLYERSDLKAIFTGMDKRVGRGKNITSPEAKDFAIEHGIPVFQPKSFRDNPLIIDEIRELQPDIIVVNAYGFILPKVVLEIPKKAAINLHASLLPKYRGASPIQSAILEGDRETGITAQLMSDKLDEGDIIHKMKTTVKDDEDYNSLSTRLSLISAHCLKEIISLYEGGNVRYIKQDDDKATFCRKIKKEQGLINWNASYEAIERQIRAYINWPQSYAYYKTKKLIINKISMYSETKLGKAGEIVDVDRKKGIFIQCGDSVVNILSLKPEGKRFMGYASFINGHSLQKGERL